MIPLIMYWSKFNILALSDNPRDWAAFGTYFSGIVLPIYTAINIVFFVIIMITIIQNDKKVHLERIKFEETLLITQFRKEAMNEFIKELDSVARYPEQKGNTANFETILNKLEMELIYQISDLEVYFPDIQKWKAILDLKKTITILLQNHKEMVVKDNEKFVNDNINNFALFLTSIRKINRKGQLLTLTKLGTQESFKKMLEKTL